MSDDVFEERRRLAEIRAQLGPLKTEAKPFDPLENLKITKVYSSIANAGSGEFHTFRKMKAREEQRQKLMDQEWDESVSKLEFAKRRNAIKLQEEQERLARKEKRDKQREASKRAKERAKYAHITQNLPQDGSFIEVMERKERLKALMAAAASSDEDEDDEKDNEKDEDGPDTQQDTKEAGDEDNEKTADKKDGNEKLDSIAVNNESSESTPSDVIQSTDNDRS